MLKTDLKIVILFENIEERELYDRLDTVIQFLMKNEMSCSIHFDRYKDVSH